MLPLDPSADRSRRAWVPCPGCHDHAGCPACAAGRACPEHWRYLLGATGPLVHLQCPSCAHLWTWDSGGARRPA